MFEKLAYFNQILYICPDIGEESMYLPFVIIK